MHSMCGYWWTAPRSYVCAYNLQLGISRTDFDKQERSTHGDDIVLWHVVYIPLTPLGLRSIVMQSSWSGDVSHNGVRVGGPVS